MISLQPERLVPLGGTTQASLVASPADTIVNPRAYASDSGAPNAATTPAVGDYFTVRARSGTIHSIGTPGVLEDQSTPFLPGTSKTDASVPQTLNTPGGLMGRLKNFGKISSNKKVPEAGTNAAQLPAIPDRAILEVRRMLRYFIL